MSQERVWQKIGSGSGGFRMSNGLSHVERDILRILETLAGKRFTVDDIVGTRSVRRLVDDYDLYGGAMRLDFDYDRNVVFRLRRSADKIRVVICYEEWESQHPHEGLSVHIRCFERDTDSDFVEHPIPASTDPFSRELWLGRDAPFSKDRQWLRETVRAKFLFE